MFSGCDIIQHVLTALFDVVHQRYDLQVPFEMEWLCESIPAKQEFLLNQHESQLLFRDAAQVATLFAHDVVSKGMCAVPYAELLVAGFPCTSKTSLSSLAPGMKSCIRNGEGTTGQGFTNVVQYAKESKPRRIILENLANLAVDSEGGESEMDFMKASLISLGYSCSHYVFDAREYGSFVPRERAYMVASLDGSIETTDMFLKVLLATATGPGHQSSNMLL